jgi:long-chain fatty acid transport protein
LRPFRWVSALLVALILIPANPALAAGYSIFEQGAKASSMAGAFAATADDPSAIFYNVAGIAFQRRMAAQTGATWITFNNEFRGEEGTFPGPDATAAYENHNFIIPTTYVVIPFGDNFTFGIGQFAAFGLRTDWENGHTFPGRFIAQDTNLKTASVQPSIAWKSTGGTIAIGAGVEYRTGTLSLERNAAAINPFTQQIIDVAHVRLEGERSDDIGFNVGVIFAPTSTLRVGLSHRSQMEMEFEGDADFTQIPSGNPQLDQIIAATRLPPDQGITTSLPFPAFNHLGIATTAIPRWTIEFNAIQMTWSEFDELVVDFDSTPSANIERAENWSDVWSYRLGADHPINDRWNVRLGAVFDETPQPVEYVGPILPDSDRVGVTFGLGYQRGRLRVDVSEMVLHFVDRDTLGRSVDNFDGVFQTSANLLTVNVGYSF